MDVLGLRSATFFAPEILDVRSVAAPDSVPLGHPLLAHGVIAQCIIQVKQLARYIQMLAE